MPDKYQFVEIHLPGRVQLRAARRTVVPGSKPEIVIVGHHQDGIAHQGQALGLVVGIIGHGLQQVQFQFLPHPDRAARNDLGQPDTINALQSPALAGKAPSRSNASNVLSSTQAKALTPSAPASNG